MTLVGQSSFDELGAPLHTVPFCVLDLETTGATAADCQITEIGAVRYVGGEPSGTFHTLVNPGVEIPPFITVLTGITHAMVVAAPHIEEALPSFLEFLGNAVIVGHNVRFDISFLNAAAQRLGYGKLSNRSTDTLRLARRLVGRDVRNLKLDTLAAHFRSPIAPTHRALDDAKATAHVFWSLLERAGAVGVTHLDDLLALPSARGSPHYAKLDLTRGLPRRPGVYEFVDRAGTTIYVGKAKNLRSRVRSYFYGDTRKTVDQMLRDVVRVDHRVCTTEIEASVTELRLIATALPRYNRRSRPPRSPHWVKLTTERWPRLSMVRTVSDDRGPYLGPFRSRRAAERVVHAVWDAVPLRRCNTRGGKRSAACTFAQLGVSVCPCDGSLGEDEYATIVSDFRAAIAGEPATLLEPLRMRMLEHAGSERFEEAATVRDRHTALATALDRRRAWRSLQGAGTLWAEDERGDGILVEQGRLSAAWNAGGAPPLIGGGGPDPTDRGVPRSVIDADEAHLVWRWLDRPGIEVVDCTGEFSLPMQPVPRLATAS